ncbi:MAG TPA: hypothetical protein VGE67_19190 [Haloferula sp.]
MLKQWLYEENLSYAEVSKRCYADLSVRVSPTAVRQHKEHLDSERLLERITASAHTATAVEAKFNEHKAPVEGALVKMLAQLAFEMSVSGTLVDPETFCAISGLVLKAKDQELKAQTVSLQRDKFEFDAAKACLAKLPELRSIASDTKLDQDAKLKQIRLKLFGVLPDAEDAN